MEQEKKNNSLLVVLLLLIVILAALCILLATGTISFKTGNQENENTNTNNNVNSNQPEVTNTNVYSPVLDEYREAIKEENKDSKNYNYVNKNAINHYFSQKGTNYEFDFKYSLYDINNDGKEELLINNGIVDIFSYDGNNIIRLFKDDANCLAETRCHIDLYDNGTIYFKGSGGASSQYIGFYSINNNSQLNTINSYYLKYGEDSVTIYDGKSFDVNNDTGDALNYKSDKELIDANIQNASMIDLNNLNWITIN